MYDNYNFLAEELQRLGIERTLIPPYHPESNSKVERMNRVLKDTMRRLLAACKKAGTDWFDVVFQVKFACNSAVSKANGVMPLAIASRLESALSE